MVKKMVVGITSKKEEADIGRELGTLDRVSLHHIRRAEEIRAICNEVISRTEGAASLVQITPVRLDALRKQVQKRVKSGLREGETKLEISEVEIIRQSAVIRSDWDSKQWKKYPPHGWAWREAVEKTDKKQKEKKEVIALVYETHDRPDQHEIYIDREILYHPRGALALIKNMKNRHQALMAWDKGKKK